MSSRKPKPTNTATDGDLVLEVRGQETPLVIPASATAWSLAQARAACLAYAHATDPAKARPLSWRAWLAVSRALDKANSASASSPRSLVRKDLETRLAGEADWRPRD